MNIKLYGIKNIIFFFLFYLKKYIFLQNSASYFLLQILTSFFQINSILNVRNLLKQKEIIFYIAAILIIR